MKLTISYYYANIKKFVNKKESFFQLFFRCLTFYVMQKYEKNKKSKGFIGLNQYKNRMFGLIYLFSNQESGVFPVIFLKTI